MIKEEKIIGVIFIVEKVEDLCLSRYNCFLNEDFFFRIFCGFEKKNK